MKRPFANRREAGEKLAGKLGAYANRPDFVQTSDAEVRELLQRAAAHDDEVWAGR